MVSILTHCLNFGDHYKALKKEQKKTKRLEKELLRKERALAETAALLVLQKKAQDLWGVSEDE